MAVLVLQASVSGQSVYTIPEEEVFPNDGQFTDFFGVQSQLNGDRLVVAAPLVDGQLQGTGAAYVFAREPQSGVWSEEAKLAVSNGLPNQGSEMTVTIDRDRVAIGYPREDVEFEDSGAVYVYERTRGTWNQVARLVPQDVGLRWRFGSSVALKDNILVVGATGRSSTAANAGAVYVFEYSGGAWQERAVLESSDISEGDLFGASLDITDDRFVAGAPGVDGPLQFNVGAAYVFVGSGASWSEEAKVEGGDSSQNDNFGDSVAIDGNTVIAGAPFHTGINCGAAYVFARNGGSWPLQTKLVDPTCATERLFGLAVDVDGDIAVVGSRNNFAGPNSGSVTTFRRSNGLWGLGTEFVGPDTSTEDLFGASVSLYEFELLVGASSGNGAGLRTGTSYLFTLQPSDSDPGTSLCFGDGTGAACPCGNQGQPGEGCSHSGFPHGMTIRAGGTASVSADDLVMAAEQVPIYNAGIFYVGTVNLVGGQPLFDGLQCASGDVRRFRGRFQTTGVATDTDFAAQDPSAVYFQPGQTYYFQYWSRDVSAPSPCGFFANFSPAHAVTMLP